MFINKFFQLFIALKKLLSITKYRKPSVPQPRALYMELPVRQATQMQNNICDSRAWCCDFPFRLRSTLRCSFFRIVRVHDYGLDMTIHCTHFHDQMWFCWTVNCSQPGSSIHVAPRQGCWSGSPFPPPGDLPHPGIEPVCPVFPALAGRFLTTEPPETLAGTLANYRIFSILLCWKMTDRFFGVHKVTFHILYNLSLMSDHPNFGYLRKSSRLNFAFDTESVF